MGRKKKHSKEFLRRSRAAKKGWVTRRRNQRQGARRTSPRARPGRGGTRRPPAPKPKMWRITVAANYYIRSPKKKNRKGESPESAAFIVRGWFRSYAEALDQYDQMDDMANEGRDEAVSEHRRAFSREEETSVSIQEVNFDERLLGTVSQVDEK